MVNENNKCIFIRDQVTNEIVSTIEVYPVEYKTVDKLVDNLIQSIDTEKLWIDDSMFEEPKNKWNQLINHIHAIKRHKLIINQLLAEVYPEKSKVAWTEKNEHGGIVKAEGNIVQFESKRFGEVKVKNGKTNKEYWIRIDDVIGLADSVRNWREIGIF